MGLPESQHSTRIFEPRRDGLASEADTTLCVAADRAVSERFLRSELECFENGVELVAR